MKFDVYYKERIYGLFMALVSSAIYAIFIKVLLDNADGKALTYLSVMIGFAIFNFFTALLFVGNLRSNAIKVSTEQFPEAFAILEDHSKKLGFKKAPDMYILQGNGMLNAFALRFSRRNYIVIFSDVFELAYQEGQSAVSFIIGHELGHLKRNHCGFIKSILFLPAKFVPLLGNAYSRACEYTCDGIGYALCPDGALKGLLILAAGKKLYTRVNLLEWMHNGAYRQTFSQYFFEICSSHPTLTNRARRLHSIANSTQEKFKHSVNPAQ